MTDRKLYKVVAGSLTRGDKRYGFGDTIELTDAEAGGAFYRARVLEVGTRVPVAVDAERIAELEGQLAEAKARIAELEGELAAGVTAKVEAPPTTEKRKK